MFSKASRIFKTIFLERSNFPSRQTEEMWGIVFHYGYNAIQRRLCF